MLATVEETEEEIEVAIWLPDADKDGFAVDGQTMEIALTHWNCTTCLDFKALARECASESKDTAEVLADWLRQIADEIEST